MREPTSIARKRKRSTASRPAPRTIEVRLIEGPYVGWQATVRVDFPAKVLEDMESGNASRVIAAAERIIVVHNFPDAEGFEAERLIDVDPFTGIVAVLSKALEGISALPPR